MSRFELSPAVACVKHLITSSFFVSSLLIIRFPTVSFGSRDMITEKPCLVSLLMAEVLRRMSIMLTVTCAIQMSIQQRATLSEKKTNPGLVPLS
jgi:hypothetical protein